MLNILLISTNENVKHIRWLKKTRMSLAIIQRLFWDMVKIAFCLVCEGVQKSSSHTDWCSIRKVGRRGTLWTCWLEWVRFFFLASTWQLLVILQQFLLEEYRMRRKWVPKEVKTCYGCGSALSFTWLASILENRERRQGRKKRQK